MNEMEQLDVLIERYPVLAGIRGQVLEAYEVMRECYEGGGKLLVAGNGGSSSDLSLIHI